MGFMKADKNMTVQDLIDELMLVKDKSKEIRVVINTNDYIKCRKTHRSLACGM